MSTLLFVYGTLKTGGRRHDLLAGQQFVQAAWTLPQYRLFDSGRYPCLVEDTAAGVAVQGEIWRVEESILPRLDAYEGVPQLFVRRQIALQDVAEDVQAYLYTQSTSGLRDLGHVWHSA